MSGLAASQALSKHFKHVVVLEKNEMKPVWQLSAVDMIKVRWCDCDVIAHSSSTVGFCG
jgi:cation diffusion facilitator CzcD-associated flavoprotein CzcO